MVETELGLPGFCRKAGLVKSTAIIAIFLMLGLTNLISGCVCFHPSVKQVPDTRPGKEGQKVVVNEELPLPCKIFWGTIWALSWIFPGKESPRDDAPGDHSRRVTSKALDEFNRQYMDKHKRSGQTK